VQIGAGLPEGDNDPRLPAWPTPRPAMLLRSPEGDAFFHPLYGADAGRELLAAWPGPARWPACPPEDNFILVGNFAGSRVWEKDGGPWKRTDDQDWQPGDGISVTSPPDRPDEPALLMDKSASAVATRLYTYQWLWRRPEPKTLMVLRFRARGETPTGRLSVGPTIPLYIPNDDDSQIAEDLRKRSAPHLYMPAKPGFDVREYRFEDWIQPTPEWRTYCVVFEWPPFGAESGGRNIVVEYHGLGKIWLANLELFTWERGNKR
jgi:hypothetical protein